MNLLVIGATGSIGSAAVTAALDAGHEVTAFVRTPEKLADLRGRVRVVVATSLIHRPWRPPCRDTMR